MVEQTQNTTDPSLDFFDELFGKIPPVYRQVDPEYLQEQTKKSKTGKKNKEARLSLADLNERAQAKIEEMRRVNREKSQKKIAELTKQHQEQGLGKHKKEAAVDDEESQSSDDDEEMKEETKSKPEASKGKSPKDKYENKHAVAESKLKNKRALKEALKKNKLKRQKGTTKVAAEKPDEKMEDSGSDNE